MLLQNQSALNLNSGGWDRSMVSTTVRKDNLTGPAEARAIYQV
jgi:hypothetical protein